jgi:cytochrome oxidase Cu insertion factor (SCO1/SenC/PrrC family)
MEKKLSALVTLLSLLLIFLLLFLPACSQSQKATPAPPFELTNQFGEITSLSQLRGKVVVLTFLYSHCPVVCPLIISKVQQAMIELGDPATDEVALVVVTVDPERYTVERLREYTSSLPFNWLYLTGEPGQLKVVWGNYGIYVEPQKEKMAMEEDKMTMEGQSHAGQPHKRDRAD